MEATTILTEGAGAVPRQLERELGSRLALDTIMGGEAVTIACGPARSSPPEGGVNEAERRQTNDRALPAPGEPAGEAHRRHRTRQEPDHDSPLRAYIEAETLQIQDVQDGIAEADRGEFASDEDVNSFFAKMDENCAVPIEWPI